MLKLSIRLNKKTFNFLTSTLKLWSDVQGLWLVAKLLMASGSRNTQNGQIQDTQGDPGDTEFVE